MNSLAVFGLAILAVTLNGGNAEKLHVGVYYESLCPDSVRFIQNQLLPNYEALKDHIDVQFIPFGKSQSFDGGDSWWCQHGEPECIGNTLQSCTLYSLNGNPDAKMAYVGCQMAFPYPTDMGRNCAAKVGVDYNEVHQCYYGGLGTQLQLEAERVTHKIRVPYPSFVPTIVFDHKFDQELLSRSLSEFGNVVCELIGNAAPACSA